MSRVFIINDLNHNFDRAARYGTLVYVTEGKVPIFKTDIARNMVRQGLEGFTENDYLLISGPPVLCMMAVLEVLKRDFVVDSSYIQTLMFDAKEQNYVVRHLPV